MSKFDELDKAIKDKAIKAFDLMNKSGKLRDLGVDKFIVLEARRSVAVQMAYYSRSRMLVEDVKKMYKAAGLYAISDAEAMTKNTNTLESKHIDGLALDIVPMKNGSVWWSAPDAVWQEMGRIGKSCGLIWGGDWKGLVDTPHFEV